MSEVHSAKNTWRWTLKIDPATKKLMDQCQKAGKQMLSGWVQTLILFLWKHRHMQYSAKLKPSTSCKCRFGLHNIFPVFSCTLCHITSPYWYHPCQVKAPPLPLSILPLPQKPPLLLLPPLSSPPLPPPPRPPHHRCLRLSISVPSPHRRSLNPYFLPHVISTGQH